MICLMICFFLFHSEGHIGLERKVTKLEAMVKMLQEDLKKVGEKTQTYAHTYTYIYSTYTTCMQSSSWLFCGVSRTFVCCFRNSALCCAFLAPLLYSSASRDEKWKALLDLHTVEQMQINILSSIENTQSAVERCHCCFGSALLLLVVNCWLRFRCRRSNYYFYFTSPGRRGTL